MVAKKFANPIKDFGFYWAEDGSGHFDITGISRGIATQVRDAMVQKFGKESALVGPLKAVESSFSIQVNSADHLYMIYEAMDKIVPGIIQPEHVDMVAAGMHLQGKGLRDPERIYKPAKLEDSNHPQSPADQMRDLFFPKPKKELTTTQTIILEIAKREIKKQNDRSEEGLAAHILRIIPWAHGHASTPGQERLGF